MYFVILLPNARVHIVKLAVNLTSNFRRCLVAILLLWCCFSCSRKYGGAHTNTGHVRTQRPREACIGRTACNCFSQSQTGLY